MSLIGCAGSDELGANFTPPTLGAFMQKQQSEIKRLREAKAGNQVIKEAREFHERQAKRFGVNTNRGLAHFRASKMFTREGNRLQEMFDQGGQDHSELSPKAVMKASKAAMLFHKKQAEKAGLDTELGHAHVAAMEHHADIHKKAKANHQASQPEVGNGPMDSGGQGVPMKASSEGGKGSGRHKSTGLLKKGETRRGNDIFGKDKENPTHYLTKKTIGGESKTVRLPYDVEGGKFAKKMHDRGFSQGTFSHEALPGHGSKQSPVPVPKKSEQPNQDIKDQSKPPVSLDPEDANKPLRKLQQNESREGGPGSGRHKENIAILERAGFKNKGNGIFGKGKHEIYLEKDGSWAHYHHSEGFQKVSGHPKGGYKTETDTLIRSGNGSQKLEKAIGRLRASESSSVESRIRNFGRKSQGGRGPDYNMSRSDPKGAGTLMDDDLVYRGPRTKEARRSLQRSQA
jgi:hypothetical protein